jgi:DNA-binding IclR family transcriptional regulator
VSGDASTLDVAIGNDGVRLREVPAVRRATAILWHLARNADGLGVSRIARDLGIIPSTCLHILRELATARLVSFEPNGKIYRLGLGVLALAREVSRRDPFIQAAQPALEKFARDFRVSASATQRDGEDMVVVASATAPEGDVVTVGNRVPCLSSASGRLIAAFSGWTDTQLRTRFDRVRWQHTPDFAKWLREVHAARARKYAIDDGQFRRGITSIASGVISRAGSMSHTISINVVSAQLDAARRAIFIDAVQQTSGGIAQSLD